MLYGVPQHIGVEDKIVGPLTGKQLLWVVALGIVGTVIWMLIPSKAAAILAILIVSAFFISMAFYRPYDQPLSNLLLHGGTFLISPKVYVWKRSAKDLSLLSDSRKKRGEGMLNRKKDLSIKDVEILAETLDTRGKEKRDESIKIMEKNKGSLKQSKK